MSAAHNLFELPLDFRQKFLLFCAPDPPPTSDYAKAAREQGVANVEAAKIQGKINNPNVIGPYGRQEVRYGQPGFNPNNPAHVAWNRNEQRHIDKFGVPIPTTAYRPDYRPPEGWTPGDPDQATIIQTLTPDQQTILDKGNQAKIGMTDLAVQGTNIARDVLGNRMDFGALPERPGSAEDTRTKVLNATMARVNEDVDRQQGLKESNLLAAGIPKGSKAYNDAMALGERARTDARNQAYLASGQEMSRMLDAQAKIRRDALAEMVAERQMPLNEITALMSGSQVNNQFAMPGYAQNANVQAAPLFAAQNMAADYNTDLYNVRAAQAGNLQQGLFGLGGAGMMGGAMMMSDRRLKSNIVKIGRHPVGVDLYEYDIFDRHEQGVMADELEQVMPEAVITAPSGYQMVNYALIGGRDGLSLQ